MTAQDKIDEFIRQARADMFTGGRPRSKAEAERRFRCESMSAIISGGDCARRHVRANSGRRLSQTFDAGCVGCAFGEARAELLGLDRATVESEDKATRTRRARRLERRGNKRIAKTNAGIEERRQRARASKKKKPKRAKPHLRLVGEPKPEPRKQRRAKPARPPAEWAKGLDLESRIDKVGLAKRLGLPREVVNNEITRLRRLRRARVAPVDHDPVTAEEMMAGEWFIEPDLDRALGDAWPCSTRQLRAWADRGHVESVTGRGGRHSRHRLLPGGVADLKAMLTLEWKTLDGVQMNRRQQVSVMEADGRLLVRKGNRGQIVVHYLDDRAEVDLKAGAYMASVEGVPSGEGRPILPGAAKWLKAYRGRLFRAGILNRTGRTSSTQWWVIDEGRFAEFLADKGLGRELARLDAGEPLPARGMGWLPPAWARRIDSMAPGMLGSWTRDGMLVRVGQMWWSLDGRGLVDAVRGLGLDPKTP